MTLAAPSRTPPVVCVIADRHRDVGVAEDAVAGTFTHCGVRLELGPVPDWSRAGRDRDPEWLIECSKFLWGLDLAHAFAVTGDVRFAEAWERLVRSWIDQVSVRADATEVAARRLQNWTYAHQAFAAAPAFAGFGDAFEEAFGARLAAEAAYVREELTPERNHRTLELYGLLVFALAFPELDGGGALAELARTELERNLEADVRPDGVHREASTHYHLLVLRSFLGALANGRRFGLEFGDDYARRLERACEFALHVHRPDGTIAPLSDADADSNRDVLELAAALFDRPDFLYAATGGEEGLPPARRRLGFPDGGYYIQRSGWGAGGTPFEDERFLVFDCGPVGDGGHGHYDLLSIDVAANGRSLVVDPGRYTYAEGEPNLRRWFRSTAAHNTVTVDGLDQTPYARGKNRGAVAHPRFLGRTVARGVDVLRGRASSPCYDATHTRTVAFVDDAYWIVEDRLEAPGSHRYDLRFHLAAEAKGATGIDDAGYVHAPGLLLAIVGADDVVLESGWVSPAYGVKLEAPVVSAVRTARCAVFTSLLLPIERDATAPRFRVVSRAGSSRIEVEHGGRHDVVAWTADSASLRREGRA